MIKYILLVFTFSAFIIPTIFSCQSLLCAPFSNNATITYHAEPSASLTYNTNISRVSGQYPTADSLASSLENTANNVINTLANQANANRPLFTTVTIKVNESGLLNADIIPQVCPDNNPRTIAGTGTFFIQNNKVLVRLQPENCTNGNLQPFLSAPALTTISYEIGFKTSLGLTLCFDHWTMIANAIQSQLESDTKSTFLGKGVIAKTT